MSSEFRGTVAEYQALYIEKNAHLDQFLEQVTPYEFYREIFPGLLSGRGIMRTVGLTGSLFLYLVRVALLMGLLWRLRGTVRRSGILSRTIWRSWTS